MCLCCLLYVVVGTGGVVLSFVGLVVFHRLCLLDVVVFAVGVAAGFIVSMRHMDMRHIVSAHIPLYHHGHGCSQARQKEVWCEPAICHSLVQVELPPKGSPKLLNPKPPCNPTWSWRFQ